MYLEIWVLIAKSLELSALLVFACYSKIISVVWLNAPRIAESYGLLVGLFLEGLLQFRVPLEASVVLVCKEHLSCVVAFFVCDGRWSHNVHSVYVLIITSQFPQPIESILIWRDCSVSCFIGKIAFLLRFLPLAGHTIMAARSETKRLISVHVAKSLNVRTFLHRNTAFFIKF